MGLVDQIKERPRPLQWAPGQREDVEVRGIDTRESAKGREYQMLLFRSQYGRGEVFLTERLEHTLRAIAPEVGDTIGLLCTTVRRNEPEIIAVS